MASFANEPKGQDSKCNRDFQSWWTEKHGMISKGDKVVCVLCSGIVTKYRSTRNNTMVTNNNYVAVVAHATCLTHLHAEIVEVEIEVVSPSIVPSGNFAELNRTVTCMVLKANDRRTSCPCHDEFRGPRSDYVRQVASENNNNNNLGVTKNINPPLQSQLLGLKQDLTKDFKTTRAWHQSGFGSSRILPPMLVLTATAGSDVVQSGRPIFDDFFQHLWPYIGNNTANVVFQMVKRLWLIPIDQ
ncbi:hypothetical protein TNCV_3585031 [Trichonephila clavipes]|nr:hypothetical protein TNCV_3585031 [Trichonephila clavipes]